MRRAAGVLLTAALLFVGPAPAEPAPRVVELEGIAGVQSLRRADMDHDGIVDLLLLDGRTLHVWLGGKGVLPAPRGMVATLPDTVSFVDVPPRALASLGLLQLGTGGLRIAAWGTEAPDEVVAAGAALTWRDTEKATFIELVRDGGLLIPEEAGWRFKPWDDGPEVRLPLVRYRDVQAPGPFLEDTCDVTHALPEVFVGAPAAAGAKDGTALWAITGTELVCQTAARRVSYDLSFLGAGDGSDFDQTLVDLDGDRRPDVLHRIYSNREVRYGFFRTPPAKADVSSGPSHKPAATTLFLSGFQLDPEMVDLDGDGLKDLVITSMQVNAANMVSAMTSGKVTAETRAFLNRSRAGGREFFRREPDAVIKSQIEVKVQFNYAGNIEVVRSLLIVLDGDFDGDGRKDLAIRTGPAVLSLRRGVAAGVWAAQAEQVPIPPLGDHPDIEGYAADLDGDHKDEIVLVYRKPPGGRDIVRLLDPSP